MSKWINDMTVGIEGNASVAFSTAPVGDSFVRICVEIEDGMEVTDSASHTIKITDSHWMMCVMAKKRIDEFMQQIFGSTMDEMFGADRAVAIIKVMIPQA